MEVRNAFEKILSSLKLDMKFEPKNINPYRRRTMPRVGKDFYVTARNVVEPHFMLGLFITLPDPPTVEAALEAFAQEIVLLHDCPTAAHWVQANGGGTATADAKDAEFTFAHAKRQSNELKRLLGIEAFNVLVFGSKVAPDIAPKPLPVVAELLPKEKTVTFTTSKLGKSAALKAEKAKARSEGKKVVDTRDVDTTAEVFDKGPITPEEAKRIALDAEADAIGANEDNISKPNKNGDIFPMLPIQNVLSPMIAALPPGVPLQQQGIAGNAPTTDSIPDFF